MTFKQHLGDVLKQLMEAPDDVAMMEIIDSNELLNSEMPEASADGEALATAQAETEAWKTKFKDRFMQELTNVVEEVIEDDELDDVVEEDENDGPDYGNMSYDDAGITDIRKG